MRPARASTSSRECSPSAAAGTRSRWTTTRSPSKTCWCRRSPPAATSATGHPWSRSRSTSRASRSRYGARTARAASARGNPRSATSRERSSNRPGGPSAAGRSSDQARPSPSVTPATMPTMPMKDTLWLLAMLTTASSALAAGHPTADLIVTNARVWTVDPKRPEAEALAIVGERLVAVGNRDEGEAWRGPSTEVIDAGRRRLVPGFNDSHVHFVDGSAKLSRVDLKDARSPEEFTRRIAAAARALPKGQWVLGGNWDDQGLAPPRLPARGWMDATTPDHPVWVDRYDGHMAVANSRALQLAGVTAATKDPPGGEIVRDAKGEPTGLLKDAAMGFVGRVVPPLTAEARLAVIRPGLKHPAPGGRTSVQGMNPAYHDAAHYAHLLQR